MSQLILAVSLFFHLLATVIWLGGLLATVWLVLPATQRALADQPARAALAAEIRRRFVPVSQFALAILIVTGLTQMAGDEQYDGVMQITNDWSRAILFKHVAVLGMVAIGLVLQYAVVPALERARLLAERGKGDPAAYARLHRREVALTWLNVGLAVVVLGFTAWAASI